MGLPHSNLLFSLSHRIRHHPIRFLVRGDRLCFFSPTVQAEEEICRRCWMGPIWDVGASLGKYTVMIARANPSQPVYAFEPNLNSLYYLGYRTAQCPNVTIVPCALAVESKSIRVSYDPDYQKPATGPFAVAFSVAEAITRFGVPAFVKLDCEGPEREMLERCGELLRHT